MAQLTTHDVFGISNKLSTYSYVDRGALDAAVAIHLSRPTHIAIKGASKAGKTWLRQRVLPKALVISCRLGKTVEDIYQEALADLGIKLELSRSSTKQISGTIEGQTEIGVSLIGRVVAKLGLTGAIGSSTTEKTLRQPVQDLKFIAEVLILSGRRLVIDDFHYLSQEQRRRFAFDLKALWDMGLFVLIIGVWSESNLLTHLNHDLTGRVREESVVWSPDDLQKILDKGSAALNISFSNEIMQRMIEDSYGNAGILQRLALETLDRCSITHGSKDQVTVADVKFAEEAALYYAEELNTTYQAFAQSVAQGVRTYPNSTGIYGHALAVVFESTDAELTSGVHIDTIYQKAHGRQHRIQKGNLRTVLEKFEQLQVDDGGRGLVLSYADDRVRVVDRQLLLYRKYSTVSWPWDRLIEQAEGRDDAGLSGDPEDRAVTQTTLRA